MAFKGTVESDYLKLVSVEDPVKRNLIDYSATDFVTLRDALVKYVKAVYPLDYNNFIESDLGVMLIELVSYMGSTLSFKADTLANESFLRTARQRNSVSKLLELIGVRMKGPIAAVADASLTFDNPPWVTDPTTIAIAPVDRSITISSSEDGAPLNYTIYKVVNGFIDSANDTGELVLATDTDGTTAEGREFTNLILLEGGLVAEEGSFLENRAIKTIPLTESPIIEGSVQVYVNGDSSTSGAYTQVDNIYFASGSGDRVFQLVSTDDFKSTIVFGDSNLGTSPHTSDSYFVTYRVGGGSRGNITKEFINTQVTVTSELGAIAQGVLQNISPGLGGADAETVDHAKKYGPLTFRRQDRLVTLPDFKSFANTFITDFGSTGKATAVTRRAYSSANIIDLFVLERANDFQLRKASPSFKAQLIAAIEPKKMLTTEIVVVDGLIRTLDLAVTVSVDREYQPKQEIIKLLAKNKILDYFRVDNNDFGKAFIASDITRQLFEVDEIRFATIDNVEQFIKIDFREIIQLNNLAITLNFV